jgi:hypothetical protein
VDLVASVSFFLLFLLLLGPDVRDFLSLPLEVTSGPEVGSGRALKAGHSGTMPERHEPLLIVTALAALA